MPTMDYLHTEIGTEEMPAIDYCHLRLLNSWRLQPQRRRFYVGYSRFVRFGLTVKFAPSIGFAPLVESVK